MARRVPRRRSPLQWREEVKPFLRSLARLASEPLEAAPIPPTPQEGRREPQTLTPPRGACDSKAVGTARKRAAGPEVQGSRRRLLTTPFPARPLLFQGALFLEAGGDVGAHAGGVQPPLQQNDRDLTGPDPSADLSIPMRPDLVSGSVPIPSMLLLLAHSEG